MTITGYNAVTAGAIAQQLGIGTDVRWVESWAGRVIDTSGVEKDPMTVVKASLRR